MKQIKKTNQKWKLSFMLPLAGLMAMTMGFASPAFARPDLQVRVWVDANSVHKNTNNTYNFTIRGQLKNVGNSDYVSRRNQQVLFLHQVGRSNHITNWHFSRLNRGQVMKVHVPVINQPGGEFVPSYELALSFDPDIYLDKNPANDDHNRHNNQATLSNRTLSNAFARARRTITVRPAGVRPGVIRPNIISPKVFNPKIKTKPDLITQVINAQSGLILVKNIGLATARPSHLFILCSRIKSHYRGNACVNPGLRLPNFITRYNGFSLRIPALRSGASYRVNLWGRGAIPVSAKVPDTYAIRLSIDWDKQIAESNEGNNLTRLNFTFRDIITPRPVGVRPGVISGKKPDLVPVIRGSNPFKLKFKVKNQGRATAGASKLAVRCKKLGYRGPGGGCPNSPALARYSDASLPGFLVFTVPSLRAGQVYTASLPAKGLKWLKSKYKFTVKADASRVVAESNERNNVKSMVRRR